ncbi:MAG: magnesium transporter [Acidilobaceae archaeon]
MLIEAFKSRAKSIAEITVGLSIAYVMYAVNIIVIALLHPIIAGRKEVIAVIPVMNDLRGDIMGSSGSRMNTALHLGEVRAKTLDLTVLESKIVIVTTLLTTLTMVFVIYAYSIITGDSFDIKLLQLIGFTASIIATLILLPYTAAIAAITYSRGWNPGNILPTLTTVGGDFLSFPIIVLSFIIISAIPSRLSPLLFLATISISVAVSVAIVSLSAKARRVISERIIVIALILVLEPLAGILLAQYEGILSELGLFQVSISFIGVVGALSSIIALRLSVHLHIYGYRGIMIEFLKSLADVLISSIPAIILISSVGFMTTVFFHSILSMGFAKTITVIAISMVIAVVAGSIVAFSIAMLSFKLGLDPDNVAVPAVTTAMDVVGIITLSLVAVATV